MPSLIDLVESARSVLSKPACKRNLGWSRLVCAGAIAISVVGGTATSGAPVRSQSSATPVINEIMYHPAEEQDELQFIELHNPSSNKLDLAGWSISGQVRFRFSWGTTMEPGGYAVICRDIAAFRARFGADVKYLGTFEGRLGHSGGKISLVDPGGRIVESVNYTDRQPWPLGADGYGPSLERICPAAPADDPLNWTTAGETGGQRSSPGRVNHAFAPRPLPRIADVQFKPVGPETPTKVTALISTDASLDSAVLEWSAWWGAGNIPWTQISMHCVHKDECTNAFEAVIPPQPEGRLVRFRIRARDACGVERVFPAETELRPTFTFATFVNTNTARIPFLRLLTMGKLKRQIGSRRQRALVQAAALNLGEVQPSWSCALVYMPVDSKDVLVYDYVQIRSRRGGFKVHLPKDMPLAGMTAFNVIFESLPRFVLAEHLAYELYRMADVAAPHSEHVRLWVDDRELHYYLLVEQPNEQFLRRNGRDPRGDLYKLIWYQRGLVAQHEKKINVSSGHKDLLALVEGLNHTSGAEQWDFIQQNFNVDALINYYAVNMLIQNWDGFWNNYFAYHDPRPGGKWELIPWDEDKTWGYYDGSSRLYSWYEMPLTMGMKGDRPPRNSFFERVFWQGHGWWRPPGHFSGPILANPEFRRRFLSRVRDLCHTVFTSESMAPVIERLAERVRPEVEIRARTLRIDPRGALREFDNDIRSFHAQVNGRRRFLLEELE